MHILYGRHPPGAVTNSSMQPALSAGSTLSGLAAGSATLRALVRSRSSRFSACHCSTRASRLVASGASCPDICEVSDPSLRFCSANVLRWQQTWFAGNTPALFHLIDGIIHYLYNLAQQVGDHEVDAQLFPQRFGTKRRIGTLRCAHWAAGTLCITIENPLATCMVWTSWSHSLWRMQHAM
jgi:hypothetical protein